MKIESHRPLGPLSSLGVGGPARFFIEATTEQDVIDGLAWAEAQGIAVRVLGGGTNVVIADSGVPDVVLQVGIRGVETQRWPAIVEVTAHAGEPWDDLVRATVSNEWAGLECLSGIPGKVGATPIQNVGAYGQEVSETIQSVRAFDRLERQVCRLGRDECGFSYRDSVFKSILPDRYVILAVTYRLVVGGAPAVRYADVERALTEARCESPTLSDVRRVVLAVRARKSMLLDSGDPNGRSCGSFFLNPIVDAQVADEVERASENGPLPRYPAEQGRVKLSAAWLIERAGFRRGERSGNVGLSSRHTLALVCHDGATADEVVTFARRVRDRVEQRFGIRLAPEPCFWGFERPFA